MDTDDMRRPGCVVSLLGFLGLVILFWCFWGSSESPQAVESRIFLGMTQDQVERSLGLTAGSLHLTRAADGTFWTTLNRPGLGSVFVTQSEVTLTFTTDKRLRDGYWDEVRWFDDVQGHSLNLQRNVR